MINFLAKNGRITKLNDICNMVLLREQNYVGDFKDKNYDVKTFISKYFFSRKAFC